MHRLTAPAVALLAALATAAAMLVLRALVQAGSAILAAAKESDMHCRTAVIALRMLIFQGVWVK